MDTLEQLRREATCPICLEYFRRPVIIDCGHNFCHLCISQTWGGLTMGPCPECREVSQSSAPRINRVLVSVVELVKQLHLHQKKRTNPHSCPAHAEPLNFYCLEDQRALCVVCTMSSKHFSHHMLRLEQAIQEGKVPQSQASTGSSLLASTEVHCGSCLVPVTDFVTPNCEHSFCRMCVARSWVCPICKPKPRPKARLSDPAVMLTPVTVLHEITSANSDSDLDEPHSLRQVNGSYRSSLMQHHEITEPHLSRWCDDGHQRKSPEQFKNPRVRSHSLTASFNRLKVKARCESREQKIINRTRLVELRSKEDEKILEKAPDCFDFTFLQRFEDVRRRPNGADTACQLEAIGAKPDRFKDGKSVRCGVAQQEDDMDMPFKCLPHRDKTYWRKLFSSDVLSR